MQNDVVYQFRCSAESVKSDIAEVYRYLGLSRPVTEGRKGFIPLETVNLVNTSIAQMQQVIKPRAVYAAFDLNIKDNSTDEFSGKINFAGHSIFSRHLQRNLLGCSRVVLFAATIGPQVDAMIQRYTKIDSAKAAVLQATGAMFAESFVDMLNNSIRKEFSSYKIRPRFSPGYGDLSLEVQSLFFSLLSCTQKIGLTLTDSFVMAPEKSVTGFIGLEPNPNE